MKPIQIQIDPLPTPPEEQFRQHITQSQAENGFEAEPLADPICPLRPISELEAQLEAMIPPNQGDIWDPQMLGIEIPPGSIKQIFTFMSIPQDWLKSYAKLLIRAEACCKTFNTLQVHLTCLKSFSKYLHTHHPFCRGIEYIDRGVITGYLRHLKSAGYQDTGISLKISGLRAFFEIGKVNKWFDFPPDLFHKEDYPKLKKSVPGDIPDSVLAQLNAHLEELPAPVMRMVLVLQECGLRMSELISLKLDCITQDAQGDWFLGFERRKVKAEHRIPITPALVAVIQEQQHYIRQAFENPFPFLFCSNVKGGHPRKPDPDSAERLFHFTPAPKPVSKVALGRYLNRIAQKHHITDDSGKLWHFKTHQFRHTVGTTMVNNGVPLHIIQRYLGHASPEMTLTYARIHDQTLKQEFLSYRSKVVTITGEVVEELSTNNGDDTLQWMKRNILAQTLPNGSCARPVIKGPCPHANACLTCADFRTTLEFLSQHEAQLEQTQSLIERAKANGWQRQAEMNQEVATNLTHIITSLKAGV